MSVSGRDRTTHLVHQGLHVGAQQFQLTVGLVWSEGLDQHGKHLTDQVGLLARRTCPHDVLHVVEDALGDGLDASPNVIVVVLLRLVGLACHSFLPIQNDPYKISPHMAPAMTTQLTRMATLRMTSSTFGPPNRA